MDILDFYLNTCSSNWAFIFYFFIYRIWWNEKKIYRQAGGTKPIQRGFSPVDWLVNGLIEKYLDYKKKYSIKLPFKKRSNEKTVFFLHLAEINDLNHFSKW